MMRFVGEHPVLGAAGALPFLPPDFFHLGALRGDEPVFPFFNFVEQQAAREETIHPLLARRLAFHLHAGRPMHQHDARGNLVHILPTVAAGADKRFLDVRLAYGERGHARGELVFFFEADGKRTHAIQCSEMSRWPPIADGNYLLANGAMA